MSDLLHGAGRFGFQKEMNALQSLTTGNEEEAYNTTALLRSTHEVETRIQEIYRQVPTLKACHHAVATWLHL